MTLNKKHCLIFLAVFVILLVGMTQLSAADVTDTNNTKKIADNKDLSTPQNYDVDKMVQSEVNTITSDADVEKTDTTMQENKEITKKIDTTTKQETETKTVTQYSQLKTILTGTEYTDLTIILENDLTSDSAITVNNAIEKLIIDGNGKTINGNSKAFLTVNNLNLTIQNITITNCTAYNGAVLNQNGGETTITNTTLKQNRLTSDSTDSGVIKVSGNGILTLDNNTFEENSIYNLEGFIISTTKTSKIVNNLFLNNHVDDEPNNFRGLINTLVNEIHDNDYVGNKLTINVDVSFKDHNDQVLVGKRNDFIRDININIKNVYNETVKNGTLEADWNDVHYTTFEVVDGIAHVQINNSDIERYHDDQYPNWEKISLRYMSLDNSYQSTDTDTILLIFEDISESELQLELDEMNETINLGQNVTVKGHFYRKYYPDPSDYEHYEWVGVPDARIILRLEHEDATKWTNAANTTTDSEGNFVFEYTPTKKGLYDVNIRLPQQGAFPRIDAFLASEVPDFTVLGYATNITFSATDVTVGEEVTVSGYIYDVLTGNPISLSVASGKNRLTLDLGNGTSIRLTYTNGQFSTTFTPTAAGTFTATITFPANGNYEQSFNTTQYRVSQVETNMTINNPESILVGQNLDIRGVLSTEGGSPVKNTKVKITVDTTLYPDVTVNASGQYALSCTLDEVGTYPITVVYVNHTTGYTSSTNTSSVIVNPRNTNMTIENNETILVGQTVTINGTLTDELNDPVKDTYVNISIGEKLIENVEVNSEGFYTTEYQIDTVGTYDIIVVYTNDTTRYNSSTNKSSVTVNPRSTNMTIQNNESIIVGQEVTITGILTDELGKIIPNTYVNITIGTIEINNVIVNETGEFENKTIIDEVGNFTIKVVYNNHTTNYTSSTNTSNVTVNPRNTNMTVNNNETIYVGQFVTINGTLTDELNDTVKDTYVNITVGDALIENVRVDSEGFYTTEYQINVTDTLPITVVYTNDTTRYISSTNISSVNVIPRNTNMTITNNASVLVGQEVNITGVLYDNLDEVIPNTVLTIRIGKYFINDELTVDENGRYELIYPASEVGEHNITITYTSDNTNYTSSINMSSFLVKPRATNMTIEHNGPIRVGENLTVSGYLIDELGDLVVNTHVNITVGNQKAENVIVDGNGYYEHDFTLTHNDTYIITVEYLNDSMYYISSTNKTEYKLEKVATSTNVTVVNDKLYNVTIDVVVYENTTEFDKIIKSGILNVTVNGNSKLYTVTGSTTRIVLEGNVNITTTDELELTVEYLSNDYYLNSTNLTLLHASPLNSSLTVDFWGFPYQVLDTVNITGQVFDEYGNVITSGTVDIVINDDISNPITGVPIKFDENRGAYVYNYEHITPVGDINNVTVYYTGQKTSQGNYLILPSVNNNSYNASKIYVSIDIIVLNNTYGNSSVYINCTNGTYPDYGLTPNGTVVVSDYDDDIFGYRFEIDLAQQDTPGEFNITLPLYKENNRVKIEYFGNEIFMDNVYAYVPKLGPIENWKDIYLEPHETLTTISLVDPTSGEVVETVMSGGVLNITGHVSSIEGESSIEDEIRENGHVDIKVYKYNETTGEYEYSSIIEGISIDPLTGNYVYSMNIEELPNHIDSQKLQFIAFYENMNSLIAPSESNVVNLIIAKNPTITNVEKILSNKTGEVALRINVTNITGKLVETGHVIVFNATSGAVLGEGNLENGRVDISLDDVTIPGDILVNVTYQGNPYYSSSKASGNTPGLENTTTITVTVDPSITISLDKAVTIIGESVRVSGIAFNVTNQPVTSGSVNVTIGGNDYIATLDTTTGEYYFDYIPTANGTFTINATYIDDDVQVVTSEDVLLLVNKINSTTKVAIINSTAGNVTLNISVEGVDGNKTMTGTVSIIIDGNTVVPLELTGKESYIVNLENNLVHSGLVSVQVIFNENMQYYSSKAETDEINVLNQTPILKVEMLEANVVNSTTATITGTLTDDLGHNISDAYIEVMVDGENVGVVRTNSTGGFTFEYTANKLGENIVNVTYLGDNIRYSNATNSTKFTVYKLNTTVELNVSDINYTDDEVLNFTVNETDATGIVSVEVTGDVAGFTPINGNYEFNGDVLRLPLSGLKAGTYTVTVSYPGDGKYNANSTTRTFKVENQPDYNINVSAVNITYGEEETISVSLPEDAKGTVNVKISGININYVYEDTIDLSGGNMLVIPGYGLVVGDYEVKISYSDDNYAQKTNLTEFSVAKAESHIAVSVNDVVGTETAVAELTISDTNADGKANITIYDSKNEQVGDVISVDRVTIEESVFADLIKLVPGIYTVNVTYYDDNNYNNSNASYTFTVNRIPTVTNVTVLNSTAGNVTINITVKGDDGAVIKEGKVNITISGNTPIEVDLSGSDYTVINLADNITGSGNISIKVLYTGNDTYLESVANNTADNKELTNITVDKQVPIVKVSVDSENVVNSTSVVISGTLTDEDENTIADRYVDIYVGDKLVASVKTDSMGKFTYTYVADSLGEVSVNATFNGDAGENGRYSNATDTTKFTVYKLNTTLDLNVSDITYPGVEVINFTVNETTATGKITLKITGDTLNFINIQEYEFEGEALSYDLSNLEAGEYTVTVIYDGDSKYNGNSTTKSFKVEKLGDYTLNVTATNITYGEEEVITVFLPSDAKGTVTVNVTGRDSATIDLRDTNVLVIPAFDLIPGEYQVNISYSDNNYVLKTNTTSFIVTQPTITIYNSTTIYVNESVLVHGTVKDIITDNVDPVIILRINGEESQVTLEEYEQGVNLVFNKSNTYTINATLLINDIEMITSKDIIITVNKIPSALTVTASEPVGNKTVFTGKLQDIKNNPIKDATIVVKVDNEIVGNVITDKDGLYTFEFNNTVVGTHNVSCVYEETDNILGSNATASFESVKKKTTITLDKLEDVIIGENITISGKLIDEYNNPVSGETINITMDTQKTSTKTDDKGNYIISLATSTLGDKEVEVTFTENTLYIGSQTSGNFEVLKQKGTISLNVPENPTLNDKVDIIGKITDTKGKVLANLPVNVTVNDKTYPTTTDKNGNFKVTDVNKVPGQNVVIVTAGNDTVEVQQKADTFKTRKINTTLTLNNTKEVITGQNAVITGKLTDEENKAVSKANITVNLDGVSKTVTTDANGNYKVEFPTSSLGQKTVTVQYSGNDTYNAANNEGTLNVIKNNATAVVNIPKDAKADKPLNVTGTLKDKDGKPVANVPVNVTVNGKTQVAITDENGNFQVEADNIKDGLNTVTVSSENDKCNIKPTTSKINATKTKANSTTSTPKNAKADKPLNITGTLKDKDGKPVANVPVNVTVNGKPYTAITDKNGNYKVEADNIKDGENTVTVAAESDAYTSKPKTTKFNATKTKANSTTSTPKNAKADRPLNITGTLKDENGKPVANVPVNVTVNGKPYTAITDKNGNYKVEADNIKDGENTVTVASETPGYTAKAKTTKFNATKPEAKVTVNKIANTKMDNSPTITGKLRDDQGKAIKDAKVTVKVNDETYTVLTDKNGNYKLESPNLKVGSNNVSVSYENDEYKKATAKTTFNTTKVTSKVVVDSLSGTIGEDITLVAHVTDNKGNKISGGNLVFKLNGRTLRTDGRFDTNNTSPLKLKVVNGLVTYTMKADLYLRAGKNITASYSGSSVYESAKGNVAQAEIRKRTAKVTVSVTPRKAIQNTDIVFTATLKDVTAKAKNTTCLTTDADIVFKVNGVSIKDAKGKVKRLNVNSNVVNMEYHIATGMGGADENGIKNYTVEAVYNNSMFYPDARNSTVFHVQRSIVNINFIKTTVKGNVLSIKANFTDYENKYLVGENNVCVKINGKTYQENGKTKYFTIKNGRVNLSGIKLASGTKVKSVMLVTGERQGYQGARATTTDITTS